MAKIGQLAASTSTTLQITYVPEFITFSTTAAPTKIQLRVLGDGTLVDLSAAASIGTMNKLGQIGSETNRYTFQVANGLIPGKNAELTITNAQAGTVNVFGYSNNRGDSYATYNEQTILGSSGTDLSDFAAVGIVALGATDQVNITYADGTVDNYEGANELDSQWAYFQGYDPSGSGYVVQNFDQNVSKLNIIPAANRTVVVLSYQPVGNIDSSVLQR